MVTSSENYVSKEVFPPRGVAGRVPDMEQVTITLSAEAADKYRDLDTKTQNELNIIMNETILTMPTYTVEPGSVKCPDNAQNIKSSSKHGSTQKLSKPSTKPLVLLVLLGLNTWNAYSQSSSKSSLVTSKLLAAVCQVESSGSTTAAGDLDPKTNVARARGAFQFWRPTWEHVTSIRRKAGLHITPYEEGSHNLRVSREYAKTYLLWLESYMRRHGVDTPTAGQLYMAYNCGPTSARRKGFKLSNAPAHTQRAAARIEKMIKAK